jgi:hypothetical protein
MIRKITLIILVFYAIQASNITFAQDAKKQVLVDTEFLKTAEIALAERDRFKAESLAKDEVILAHLAQINALRGLLQIQTQISNDWKESATARKAVIATDDKIISLYDQQILKLNERVAKAESAKLKWGFAGTVLGAALVLLARK